MVGLCEGRLQGPGVVVVVVVVASVGGGELGTRTLHKQHHQLHHSTPNQVWW